MKLFYKTKRAIACILIQKRLPLNLSEAIISFSFDDIHDTAILNGAKILNKYGFNATYYVCLDLPADDNKNVPYFDHSQLKKIVENGGELACHTANPFSSINPEVKRF